MVQRELRPAQLPKVATECGFLIGGVPLVLGVAMGFANYLVDAQVSATPYLNQSSLTEFCRETQ